MLEMCHRKCFSSARPKNLNTSLRTGFPNWECVHPLGTKGSILGNSKRFIDFYLVLRVLLFSVVQCQFFIAVTL